MNQLPLFGGVVKVEELVLLFWEFRDHVLLTGVGLVVDGRMDVVMMGWGMMMDFVFLKSFEFREHLLPVGFYLFRLFGYRFLLF